jgi:thymidylate synthase (FAD)
VDKDGEIMPVKLKAYTRGIDGETTEELLAWAFSQCYQKEPNIQAVVRNLHHQSVLEHISFVFDIQLSRVAWDQLVRHRIASYTAQSHRYTDIQEEDLVFFVPSDIKEEDRDEWQEDLRHNYLVYKKWRNKGYKKETSRYQATIGVSIKATVTFNLRSLLNLLELRTASHAQEEIREFAEEVWLSVNPLFPNLEEALERSFRHE